jgi:hypothetical protein
VERIKQSWCEFVTAYNIFFSSKTLLIGWKICWNRSPFDNQRTKGRGEDKKRPASAPPWKGGPQNQSKSVCEGVRRGRRNVLRWQQRGLSLHVPPFFFPFVGVIWECRYSNTNKKTNYRIRQ